MQNNESDASRPTRSRALLCALAWTTLGLTSFVSPANHATTQIADDPTLPAAVAAAPWLCSADPAPARDQKAAVAAAAGYFHAHRSSLTVDEIQRVADVIVNCSAYYGIDPDLVLAVIHIESRGNAFAVSHVGAMGLMQIMPPTGEELAAELGIAWLGQRQLFEPHINARMGIAYLRQLRERFDDWPTALAAYNWGPGRISQRLQSGTALPVIYSSSVLDAKHNRI